MEDLEQRMLEFVANQTGVKVKKLTLESRLLHDLGMDGDDADEFFEAYAKEFNVEIGTLRGNFRYYFGEEGGGPMIWMIVLWFLSAIVATPLAKNIGILPFWAWLFLLMISVFVAVLRINSIVYRRSGGNDTRYAPIAIRDLVACAEAGRWLEERPWQKTSLKNID